MKFIFWSLLVAFSLNFHVAFADNFVGAADFHHPHMDLEMTGKEYRRLLLEQQPGIATHTATAPDGMQPVLDLGTRNTDWLKYINQFRDASHKISLTSPATQPAYPIATPNEYNPTIVLKAYNDLLTNLPQPLKDVLVNGKDFTQNPPIADADYVSWGYQIEMVYETATRWILMKPNLTDYASNRQNDVRGYYDLKNDANLQIDLAGFSKVDSATQTRLKSDLAGLCFNAEANESKCSSALATAITANKILDFYNKYEKNGEDLWNNYFTIPTARGDIKWNGANEMHVPFQTPSTQDVQDFLSTNIQDEWRFGQWHLLLDFSPSALTHVIFEPDVTPHVNALAGNEITLDSNEPLTDYDTQWTIRHEYGHTLGFPDCYVEFYDSDNQVMIRYQLDITNLMCSRRGHIQQLHLDELRRVYHAPAVN